MSPLVRSDRDVLLSTMSTEDAASVLGRSEVWVCRKRSALIALPSTRPATTGSIHRGRSDEDVSGGFKP